MLAERDQVIVTSKRRAPRWRFPRQAATRRRRRHAEGALSDMLTPEWVPGPRANDEPLEPTRDDVDDRHPTNAATLVSANDEPRSERSALARPRWSRTGLIVAGGAFAVLLGVGAVPLEAAERASRRGPERTGPRHTELRRCKVAVVPTLSAPHR
jgi:hypothetical protein